MAIIERCGRSLNCTGGLLNCSLMLRAMDPNTKRNAMKLMPLFALALCLSTPAVQGKSIDHDIENGGYSLRLDDAWQRKTLPDNALYNSRAIFFRIGQSAGQTEMLTVMPMPMLAEEDGLTPPQNVEELETFLVENTTEDHTRLVKQLMSQSVRFKAHRAGPVSGQMIELEGQVNSGKVKIIEWFRREGFAGHLITYVSFNGSALSLRQFRKMFKDFRVHDQATRYRAFSTALFLPEKTHESTAYNLSAPALQDWQRLTADVIAQFSGLAGWWHSDLQFANAMTGAIISLYPVCGLTQEINTRDFLGGLFQMDKVSAMETQTWQLLGAQREAIRFKADGFNYIGTTFPLHGCNHLLVVLNFSASDAPDEAFMQAWVNGLQAIGDPPGPVPVFAEPVLQGDYSKMLFEIGGFYFLREDDTAGEYLAAAHQNSPQDVDYLNGYLSHLNRSNRHRQGLNVLLAADAEVRADPSMQSWHAWFLGKTEQFSESMQVYSALFANGYTNDEDFFNHIDLLLNNSKWSEAAAAIDAQFSHIARQQTAKLKKAQALHHLGQPEAAQTLIAAVLDTPDISEAIFFDALDAYAAIGDYAAVVPRAEAKLARDVNSVGALYRLGDAYFELRNYAEALKYMELAALQMPDNDNVRSYVQGIRDRIGVDDVTLVRTVIEPVPLNADLLQSMQASSAAHPEATEESIYYVRAIEFVRGKQKKESVYGRIKLHDLAGVEANKTYQFAFNDNYERLHINAFRVLDAQGQVLSELDIGTAYITSDDAEGMATHDKILNVPVPALRPGVVIEYLRTKQSLRPVEQLELQTHFFTSHRPVGLEAVLLRGDIESVDVLTHGDIPLQKLSDALVWLNRNSMQYKSEPLMPFVSELYPWIKFGSRADSWQAAGDDYLQLIEDKLQVDVPAVQIRALGLGQMTDPVEQVRALFRFVQQGINYQALEFGQRGLIPNTAVQTLQNKYGDCKDHALLLHGLLKAAGIRSHLALVNTRDWVREDFPSIDQFNHMVVFLPELGDGVFLDPTNKSISSDVFLPPRYIQENLALVLQAGGSGLRQIAPLDAEQNRIAIERTVRIDNGQVNYNEVAQLSGYLAVDFREYIKSLKPQEVEQKMREWVASVYPDLWMQSFAHYNTLDNDRPLLLEFAFQQPLRQLDVAVPAVFERVYLTNERVGQKSHKFEISEPLKIHSVTQFSEPTALNDVHMEVRHKDHGYRLTLGANAQGRVDFEAELVRGQYPAAVYSEFDQGLRDALNRLESAAQLKPE